MTSITEQPGTNMSGRGSTVDVAIIGAGPYGLAANAGLARSGLTVRVFGSPMSFWREHMPVGMWMRSPWAATSFAAPGSGLTLDDWELAIGATITRPMRLDQFIAYGDWFLAQTNPDLDQRHVLRVMRGGPGYQLQLADGERVGARRVIVAGGIAPFAQRPQAFASVPHELAPHSVDLTDPAQYAGARVAVVGAGQSALESAALLHEAGADVEVLVREPMVRWLNRSSRLHDLGPISNMLYAPADVGPAGLSRLVPVPAAWARMPRGLKVRLDRRAIRAAGSGWLVPRFKDIPIHLQTEVALARPDGDAVELRMSSGERRTADRVILGTGYRIDVRQYGFLAPELAAEVRCVNGYPTLNAAFESSIPGLHFIGTASAGTFGPFMRFVAASPYTAGVLGRALGGSAPALPAPAKPALEVA